MKVIAGLGNPGREYENTRHNVGWWLLDHLAASWSFPSFGRDFQSLVTRGSVETEHVRLLKPQTYMNLSGAALAPYLNNADFAASRDLLIIVDDVALPMGSFRIRADGSAGGHNGLKSIQHAVGNARYARLRIGIRPAGWQPGDPLRDFVLGPLHKAERTVLEEMKADLTDAVRTWILEGPLPAMNRFNRKTEPPAAE